uniref:Uncharacterized protein n=1 Tax=Lepeophtheirus salmonis TaxID=72036 RepID=A0A0K2TIV2_LEPSM
MPIVLSAGYQTDHVWKRAEAEYRHRDR